MDLSAARDVHPVRTDDGNPSVLLSLHISHNDGWNGPKAYTHTFIIDQGITRTPLE